MKARVTGTMGGAAAATVNLDRVSLVGEDFSRRTLDHFRALSCSFTRCDFRWVRAQDMCFASGMETTLYRECAFDGCKLAISVVGPARFEKCTFLDVDIKGLLCPDAEFVDCRFSGILRGAVFVGKTDETYAALGRARNEFHGNDFSSATLRDVSFRNGIDLSEQVLPTGDDYLMIRNAGDVLQRAIRSIADWPQAQRKPAELVFRVLSEDVALGQRDLFITKDMCSHLPRDLQDRIFSLLAT
jgi:uncharacterized protein YjbI with pentapeptide repeats